MLSPDHYADEGIRLLLVEDEATDAAVFGRMLNDLGPVEVVGSIGEARAYLANNPRPDCVIMDVLLPDGSGLDLVEELRTLPVVMLTGEREDEVLEAAFAYGAQDFLGKDDVTPGRLRRAVTFAVERSRQAFAREAELTRVARGNRALAHLRDADTALENARQRLNELALARVSELEDSREARLHHEALIFGARDDVTAASRGVAEARALTQAPAANYEPPTPRPMSANEDIVLDLRTVVESAIAKASQRVRRSARIQLELPDLPILVRGDFVRLRRIVIELLSYTARTREESEPEPGDRGRIEVEVGAGRHSAFVRVRDNGVSTAEAQASPVLTDERAQTLGLSLAMRLTRALQGRLLVPSRSASPGTAAELVLPPAGDVLLHAVDSGFPVI